MKKIWNNIKKIIFSIGLFLTALQSKIFAIDINSIEDISETLYGVPYVSPVKKIWGIAKTIVIPMTLLVGLIIYFKKSKSSTKKKILVTIGIIVITAILYFVVNKTIYELA